uniref:uncharacterized protein LOC124065580 n=1 Tax=Scatophagus argus TaxID=75038 RepID=UPI001ED81AB9|nr:uncharacterized protein LOC124065580 [Scatophagus argus]
MPLTLLRKDTSSDSLRPGKPHAGMNDSGAKLLADSNRRKSLRPKPRMALKSFRCYASTLLHHEIVNFRILWMFCIRGGAGRRRHENLQRLCRATEKSNCHHMLVFCLLYSASGSLHIQEEAVLIFTHCVWRGPPYTSGPKPHYPALQSVCPCGTKLAVRRQRGVSSTEASLFDDNSALWEETAGRLGSGTAPLSTEVSPLSGRRGHVWDRLRKDTRQEQKPWQKLGRSNRFGKLEASIG